MHKRNFVLIPLYEINQNWLHPKYKKNIVKLVSKLPKNDLISILKSHNNYEDSYLVHRLDKGTSGLMIIGKNYKTASDLGKLFINKKVFKSYYALLDGIMSDKSIMINSPLIKSNNNTSNKVLSLIHI